MGEYQANIEPKQDQDPANTKAICPEYTWASGPFSSVACSTCASVLSRLCLADTPRSGCLQYPGVSLIPGRYHHSFVSSPLRSSTQGIWSNYTLPGLSCSLKPWWKPLRLTLISCVPMKPAPCGQCHTLLPAPDGCLHTVFCGKIPAVFW